MTLQGGFLIFVNLIFGVLNAMIGTTLLVNGQGFGVFSLLISGLCLHAAYSLYTTICGES